MEGGGEKHRQEDDGGVMHCWKFCIGRNREKKRERKGRRRDDERGGGEEGGYMHGRIQGSPRGWCRTTEIAIHENLNLRSLSFSFAKLNN